jgi:hypothetical protein
VSKPSSKNGKEIQIFFKNINEPQTTKLRMFGLRANHRINVEQINKYQTGRYCVRILPVKLSVKFTGAERQRII